MLKRILSVMLCIATCITLLPAIAAGAEDASVNDYQIIHYDFEGDTVEEALRDKATGGSRDERLYLAAGSSDETYVGGGVAQIANTASSYIQRGLNGTEDNADALSGPCEDIGNLRTATGYTLSVKANVITPNGNGFSDVVDIGRLIRIYTTGTSDTIDLYARFTKDAYNSNTHEVKIGQVKKGQPFILVVSVGYSSDTISAKFYLSTDGGANYTANTATFTGVAGYLSGAGDNTTSTVSKDAWGGVGLGIPTPNSERKNLATVRYDDVQLYSKALNEVEARAIYTPSAEDSLVIHYDFADDPATAINEALQDKAPAGKRNEFLYFAPVNSTTSYIKDGVAHLNNDTTLLRRRLAALNTEDLSGDCEDLKALQNGTGYTLAVKAKVITPNASPTSSFSDVVDIGNLIRIVTNGTGDNLQLIARFTNDAYNTANHHVDIGTVPKNGEFILIASVGYTGTTISATFYLSTNDGISYTTKQATFTGVSDYFVNGGKDWAGVGFGVVAAPTGREKLSTNEYRDFRVYSEALSEADAQAIYAPAVEQTPVFKAVQLSTADQAADTYGIRLVSTLDSLDYSKVGFRVSYSDAIPNYSKEVTLWGSQVYTSLLAGTGKAVTAKALGGAYIYAYSITDIPASVTNFKITLVTKSADGQTEKTYGTYRVTFADGAFVSTERIDQAYLLEMASAYKATYGTYGSWIEKLLNNEFQNGTQKDEILLCEALVDRLGNDSFAVKVGKSSVLYDGYVCKLDPTDYSLAAKYESNKVLIPLAFAKTYFGNTVTGDTNGYFDLTSYCASNTGRFALSYIAASGIAVLTPVGKDTYTNLTATVGGYTNQQYLDCMDNFFDNALLPEPTTNTEQSRVVLASSPYESEYVYDYTQQDYEVNASPSILKVAEGGKEVLYASYQTAMTRNDLSEYNSVVHLQKSENAGQSWTEVAAFQNLRWQTMAEIDGKIYLIGCNCLINRIMVASYDPATGKTDSAVFEDDAYFLGGSGPCASVIANGRLYVAFNMGVASVDISKDLLTPGNWTISGSPTELMFSAEQFAEEAGLSGQLGTTTLTQFSMEEGNIIEGKDGKIYVMYRVNAAPTYGRAVLFELSADGTTLSGAQVVKFPTAQSKFSVRYDANTGRYISLVSLPTEHASHQRNVLALAVSSDLVNWTVVDTLLVERQLLQFNVSRHKHAWQYADFAVVGDDLVFIIREASGDDVNRWHDGTYITVYTVEDYAGLITNATQSGGLDIDLDAAVSTRPSYGLQ